MHTRGRRAGLRNLLLLLGTTHAHAGQTLIGKPPGQTNRNHPCARGADVVRSDFSVSYKEPPMHTRGRPFGAVHVA